MTDIGKRRRVFPDAFKLEAVAAVNGGRPIAQVASELGLPDRLVRAWLRWAALRPVSASGAPAPTLQPRRVGPSPADQAAEIAQLRRELDRVRMERDILKRAALIFGQATGGR